MKHFVEDRQRIVTDAIEAEVMLGEGKVTYLDGFPSIKVVVRSDWDQSQVAVISGGGSGHEPSHAGFVGEGMLTAAVCGEIFASPSVDAVLAAIVAVTGAPGCLLIVKNYTGDRLNFGLAAERARAMGIAVEMVIVSDDVATRSMPHPRGIAGTLFVHKVAGDLARRGASLSEVAAGAERVARAALSVGLSFGTASIPGRKPEARLGDEEVELGLGIHGEPGAAVIPMARASVLAQTMVAKLDAALKPVPKNDRVALLVNDLGGVPQLELAIFTRAVLTALAAVSREVAFVIGPGRLMTSLDMKGISISVLPLDGANEPSLLSEVSPRAWPRPTRPVRLSPLPVTADLARKFRPSSDPHRRRVLEAICDLLDDVQGELDSLDAKVGDGDTGTTFAIAARSIVAELDGLPFGDLSALFLALGSRLTKVMGGSSGVLLSIFTTAVGTAAATETSWPKLLREGATRVERYGGASRGDRTMLDALLPAIEVLEGEGTWAQAAIAARVGAEETSTMTVARAGRSAYVRAEVLDGVPDPGAVAVARIFEAIADL